jgi:NADH-quinone oxidoreductase subunit J
VFDFLFLKTYGLTALGAVAIYLLLPKPGRSTRVAGGLIGVIALAGFLASVTGPIVQTPGAWFYGFGIGAVLFATGVIVQQRAVYSALYLVLVVLCVAGLSLTLAAEFLAVATVIIYGGAIMVTYMFVIMLAQQGTQTVYDRWARAPLGACFGAFLMVGNLSYTFAAHAPEPLGVVTVAQAVPTALDSTAHPGAGTAEAIGAVVMTRHVVALEVAGLLLLLAMVGAIAIARKRFADGPKRTPITLGETGKSAAPF